MLLSELLQEFVFNCECRRLSPKTTSNYRKQIEYLTRYLKEEHRIETLERVQPRYIKAFMVMKINEGRKPAYVNDLLKAFKVFFKYAYEESYTDTLLTEKIKGVKQPKTIIRGFDKKEIKRMLDCYEGNDFLNIRNKTILIVLFDCGIRLSELIELTDVEIKDDHILISHGKGDKQRVVPKTPIVSKWLQKYIRTRNGYFDDQKNFNALFVSKYGKGLSKGMIERIVKDAGDFAEVKEDIRISPHTLRHTFAQQQLRNGLDIYSLSRLMGHENIAITQQYLHGLRDTEILNAAKTTSTIMNL